MAAMLVRDRENGGREWFVLDEAKAQVSVGRTRDCDLVVEDDTAVSRVHARFERVGSQWCISDLSRNGTFVNGERIVSARLLHDVDEILVGRTLLVFRDLDARKVQGETTEPLGRPPKLTRQEKRVLIALCRPILSAKAFRPPATSRQMADELGVGEAAVNFHLRNLYDKFRLSDTGGQSKRLLLANEALQRGAVSMRDLLEPPDDDLDFGPGHDEQDGS